MTTASHLECSITGKQYEAGKAWNLSEAGAPLLVRYDLTTARQLWNREWIPNGPSSMWRYAPVLPVRDPANIVLSSIVTRARTHRGTRARCDLGRHPDLPRSAR